MRRVLFWASIILLGLWTFLVLNGLIEATPNRQQMGWMSDAEKAGTALGSIVVLFAWSIVAVPLGIFALAIKPKD
jgi:hypothetical protein